uniref:Aldehyde dehydrogenase 3 family member B2 n=1 Tax=Phocoena sinus TaxID=42100 RepID=A0A8C9C5I7_PHOSS
MVRFRGPSWGAQSASLLKVQAVPPQRPCWAPPSHPHTPSLSTLSPTGAPLGVRPKPRWAPGRSQPCRRPSHGLPARVSPRARRGQFQGSQAGAIPGQPGGGNSRAAQAQGESLTFSGPLSPCGDSTAQLMPLDSAFIRKEPLGPGLIIAPWNYPHRKEGHQVAKKACESTEKVLAEVLPRYLAQLLCRGAGRAEETGQLLEHKFDYILFTRGPRVGKVVMAAAAEHLTPVTLELGGKNPCYVDDNCDPQTVANRVAFFRYFNAGQTCVAPDYILCSPEMQARLLPALQSAITRFYGEDPQSSPDLGRIISEKNFQRLRRLLSCGRVAIGGQSDESDRYIAPTVLVGVQETEPVMREEIFGPILPIMNVRSLDEPLALYAFSNSSQVGLDRGGSNRGAQKGETGHLPFPDNSGMGSYHSKFSSDAFSHHRACLLSPSGLEKLKDIRYSPFSACKQQLLSWALGNQRCILL